MRINLPVFLGIESAADLGASAASERVAGVIRHRRAVVPLVGILLLMAFPRAEGDEPAGLPLVSIVALETAATESGPHPARFRVHRTGPTDQPLTVSYEPSGTAKNGDDYVRLSGKVTFPPGVDAVEILVEPIDDLQIEELETITLRLISSTAPFSIALIPDTQYYTAGLFGGTLEMFRRQTQWIADHRDEWNIAFALHEGDGTEFNTEPEWQNMKSCMDTIHGVVPYTVAVGNHDGVEFGRDDTSLFNQYFPLADPVTVRTLGGLFESHRLDNNYRLFREGGVDWMILTLEFGPRNSVLAWANAVVAGHPDRKVIVLSHAYLAADGTHSNWTNLHHNEAPRNYGRENDGVDMWEKFVRSHANIGFVLNGHIGHGGQARLVGIGDQGNRVYQMACNFQFDSLGGGGFMRMFRFYPDEDRFEATSFSPFLGTSLVDPKNQFAYTNLGIFTGITPSYGIDPLQASQTATLESNDLDAIAVGIAAVSAWGFPSEIRVRFDRLVAFGPATRATNYTLSDGRPVLSARLLADGRTVVLVPGASLNPVQPYVLTATGIHSLLPSSITNPPPVTGSFHFSPVLLTANFSDGTFGEWTVVDEGTTEGPSLWRVSEGGLVQSSNIHGPAQLAQRKGTFAFYNQPNALEWGDYVFATTLRSDDDDGIGVLFRYRNAQNYYKLDFDRQRNMRKLFRMVNGVETTLATENAGYVTGASMALRVDVVGPNLKVTLDGQELFGGPVVDAALSVGTVALYSWGNAGSRFHDIIVTPSTDIPPPSIRFLGPVDHANYPATALVPLSVEVTGAEAIGVSHIEYFINDTFFARSFAPPFSVMIPGSDGCILDLKARVTDGFGRDVWTSPVSLTFGSQPSDELRFYQYLDGESRLAIDPNPAYLFSLDVSSNLADWESLGTMTRLNSPVETVDPSRANTSARFYRIRRLEN